MNGADKTRLAFAILLSILTALLGIVFIGEIADVYYGGLAANPNAPKYTVESLRSHLVAPFVLLFIWIAVIVAAYIVFELYPPKKRVEKRDGLYTLSKMRERMPEHGTSSEFCNAREKIKSYDKTRVIVWSAAFAVCLAGAIYVLVYLLTPSHYHNTAPELHTDAMGLVRHVISWIAASMIACLAATAYEYAVVKRTTDLVKVASKNGDRGTIPTPYVRPARSKKADFIFKTVVRVCVLAIAISFIAVGAVGGGADDVLLKAINICTECIGLG